MAFMATDSEVSTRGRPRDPAIDARVLSAAVALLVQEGFAATTIQAISRRAGVHTSAIYRRWPSRIELIEEAVFPGFDEVSTRPSGDLQRDLRRFVRAYVRTLASPAARTTIPGLLATYQGGVAPRPAEEWLRISVRPQFYDILRAAAPGSVDPDVDPDDVFDMLLGAILARTLVPIVANRGRSIERIVDLVMRLLRPPPATLEVRPRAIHRTRAAR
jgi:AcrR family transcriptional regulator